jgi:hypothetical protein
MKAGTWCPSTPISFSFITARAPSLFTPNQAVGALAPASSDAELRRTRRTVKKADAPLLSRRSQEDGPTNRGTNSLTRLVANDIVLLHLPYDDSTRVWQGCSKGPKSLYRRTLCAMQHILLCRVMPLLKAYQCPYPPYPIPLLPLIRTLALAN